MDTKHPDEGTIYAYVEGQLAAAAQSRVDVHVARCAECASLVAEARGLIAAASGIIGALDDVPANVVPRRRARRVPQWLAAAAVLVLAVGVSSVAVRSGLDSRHEFATASDSAPEMKQQTGDASPEVAAPQGTVAQGAVADAATPSPPTTENQVPARRASVPRTAVDATRQADLQAGATPYSRGTERLVVAPAAAPMASDAAGIGAGEQSRTRAMAPAVGQVAADRTAAATLPAPAVVQREAAVAPYADIAVSGLPRQADSMAAPGNEGRSRQLQRRTDSPLRTVRYEASPGAIIELREFHSGGQLPATRSGVNEYRWGNPAGTRLYVLSGVQTVDELERLARRLGELRVVR